MSQKYGIFVTYPAGKLKLTIRTSRDYGLNEKEYGSEKISSNILLCHKNTVIL